MPRGTRSQPRCGSRHRLRNIVTRWRACSPRRGAPPRPRPRWNKRCCNRPIRAPGIMSLDSCISSLAKSSSGLEHYTVAVGYSPDVAEHWQALALVQQRCGLSEAARETLERGLLRFGDHAPMHLAIGTLFEGQSIPRYGGLALPDCHQCDAQSAEHWWRLGRARLNLGDHQSAASALERALKLDPRSAGAHAAFAHLFAQTDDLSAQTDAQMQRAPLRIAGRTFRRAQTLWPDSRGRQNPAERDPAAASARRSARRRLVAIW